MDVINRTAFPVTTMAFQYPDGSAMLTIIVKGTFSMASEGGDATVAEEQIPVFFGDEPDPEDEEKILLESDLVPYKPRTDVVLVGSAHAPGDQPVKAIDVTLSVGDLRKTIRVIGDRRWKCASRFLPVIPTSPIPFRQIPLTYERAYGGIDGKGGGFCPENLVGKGHYAKKRKAVLNNAPLPNLEDPAHLIRYWNDHPRPVGFGFYARTWQPRATYAGTYDDVWKETRAPLPPADFSFRYYNGAHPDLQVSGFLNGNERVELIHVTPAGRRIFRLPGISPNCRVKKQSMAAERSTDEGERSMLRQKKEGDTSEPVPMALDTLCLLPEEQRFYQVWRGRCVIQDLTALEIASVTVSTETEAETET